MAINLWELGGMATSYNPLPTSYNAFNRITIPVGDYRIKVVAKSPSRASLRFITGDFTEVSRNFLLKDYFDTYEMDFSIKNQQLFYIKDDANVGDIVIQSVQLVEKPTGKTTINGISERPNDWENGSISSVGSPSASASNIRLIKQIPVEPSTDYFLSYDPNIITTTVVHYWDKNGTYITYLSVVTGTKFTSPPNAAWLNIRANFASGVGDPLNSASMKLMINQGATPVPYEPKRGERMVLPVPVKNLFNLKAFISAPAPEQSETGYILRAYQHYGPDFLKLKPNTTYTFSALVNLLSGVATGAFGRVALYNGTTFFYLNPGSVTGDVKNTITTPADIDKYTSLYVYGSSDSASVIELKNIQVEEGGPTAYTPYRVQMARKANKTSKNLIQGEKEQDNELFRQGNGSSNFDNVWENGKLRVSNGSSAVHGRGQRVTVEAGKTYTFSCSAQAAGDTVLPRVILGSSPTLSEYAANFFPIAQGKVSFTPTTNEVWIKFLRNGASAENNPVYFWNVQVEPGDTQTPYEPYKLVPRKADRKRPKKNAIDKNELFKRSNYADDVTYSYWGVQLKPNTTYTISRHNDTIAHQGYNGALRVNTARATISSGRDIWYDQSGISRTSLPLTLTTDNTGMLWFSNYNFTQSQLDYGRNNQDIQIEEGTTPTPYEPFKLLGRPARRGLEFDKTGYISSGPALNAVTHGLKEFTVDLVFTPYEWAMWTWLFGNNNDSAATKGFAVYRETNNGLRFSISTINCGGSAATDPIIVGKRHRITAVFYGSKMELYVDGVLYASTNIGYEMSLDNGAGGISWTINKGAYYPSPIPNASYEYVRFYDKAMKPNEIGAGNVVLDFTFTNPEKNLGTVFKSENGLNGTIFGNTLQLNRQARR